MHTISKTELKEIIKLKRKKHRKEHKLVIVEGIRLIEELVNQNIPFEKLFFSEKTQRIIDILEKSRCEVFHIKDYELDNICSTNNPQNIAGIIKIRHNPISKFNKIVYLDQISDPGNLGTIIRTAVAASIDGIITSQNCVDIYNSKSIRASMGTVFFAPIETHDFEWLQNQNSEIIVSSLDSDAVNYETIDKVDKSSILVIGSEAHGISEKIVKIANQKIKIPLSEKIESLNAAISTAILISKIFGFKG